MGCIEAPTTKRIAVFNHKGGVGKTTMVFNLGWMLAQKGKRVLLVDADPQCNLTGLILGYKGPSEFERFYQAGKDNLWEGLRPAFESRPVPLKAVNCISITENLPLFLLPGNLRIAEYETTLGIAQELSASIQALRNLPGSLSYLLNLTADKYKADYVLIDMNPSLGPINQNLLMTSHAFIVPTNPGYFSVMAIESLSNVLPQWAKWAKQAQSLEVLKESAYPFPEVLPKFLGIVVQKYQPYAGVPASSFQQWINEIKDTVRNKLIPALAREGMVCDQDEGDYTLASIADFKSLIAKSEQYQTPVFALSEKQIGATGVVLQSAIQRRDDFRKVFSQFADKVISLTTT